MNAPTFINPFSSSSSPGDLPHIKYTPVNAPVKMRGSTSTSSQAFASNRNIYIRVIAFAFFGLLLVAVLKSIAINPVLCEPTPAIADAVAPPTITEPPSACPASCNITYHTNLTAADANSTTIAAVVAEPAVVVVAEPAVAAVVSAEPPSACLPPQSCNTTQLFRSVRHGYRDAFDTLPFHTACHVHTFTANEACDLLQKHGPLVLHGDSLVRHLTQAVMIILADDFQNATNVFTNEKEYDYVSCQGNNAFDDGHASHPGEAKNTTNLSPKRKYCRSHSIAADVKRARELLNYCPKWKQQMLIYTGGWLPTYYTKAIFYMQGGLHSPKLDDEALKDNFGVEVPSSWTKICALLHAPGKGKPVKYLISHGVPATQAYNEAILTKFCQEPGDLHFDAFSPTNNARSVDGQHYFQDTNVLLAQLLLNTIKARFESDENI